MRRFKRLIAFFAVSAMILQGNAFASLVLTKETSVDLWYRIFYSDQARLYPREKGFEYNCIWPGSKKVHGYSVTESLEAGAKSVQEVFGSESLNLLFNDGDSVYSTGLYLKDEGRTVSLYGMTEWNGFLFCVVGGPAPNYSKYTHTTADGSVTTEFETHRRQDGFYADDGQRVYYPGYYDYDSFLYIFDLSKETWYGDCRYAKWNIEDLELQPESVRRQIMEDVTVDDDYIYITLNKNVADSRDAARSVAVFENNIDRDNPIYDDETGDIKIPERVEPASTYEESITNAVEIAPNSRVKSTTPGSMESVIINGYLVTFDSKDDILLSQSTDAKKESVFHVTDLRDVESEGVGATKTHYISTAFNKQDDCSNVFISQLIPLGGGKTWNSVTDAYIRSIIADGSSVYFLVTYTDVNENNEKVYHQKLFITDWTNPLKPTLLSQLDFVDEIIMNQSTTNDAVTITSNPAELYYYDGYFYSTTGYGLTVIKKYNENNALAPVIVKEYDYINEKIKTGFNSGVVNNNVLYNSIPMIAVVGNCLMINYQDSQNFGSQVELRLSGDKTKIEEISSYNTPSRNMFLSNLRQSNVVRYGSRIYIGANGSESFNLFPTRMQVYDFSKAFPVELSIDQVDNKVAAPYTITGEGMGINAVQIKINGDEKGYVNVQKSSGKYGTWSYTVTEPGEYTVEAVGATLVGYPKEETGEVLSFTVVATGDLEFEAEIEEVVEENEQRTVVVNPRIVSNTMSGFVNVMPVVAAYSGNKMITANYGEPVKVEKGSTYNFDEMRISIPDSIASYKVKVFLFDNKNDISAMAEFIEKAF